MVAKYLGVHDTTPETVLCDFEAGAHDISDQPRDGAGVADYAAAVNE